MPVALIASTPNVLVIHPGLAANSAAELIALARSRPGALNYASASMGSPNHLAAELFKSMAGIDLVRVPYRGTAPALNDDRRPITGDVRDRRREHAARYKAARLKALGYKQRAAVGARPGSVLATIAVRRTPRRRNGGSLWCLRTARTPARNHPPSEPGDFAGARERRCEGRRCSARDSSRSAARRKHSRQR